MSESENLTPLDIPAALEALLFVSAEPVAPSSTGHCAGNICFGGGAGFKAAG